jgi:AraC-like DNA-binding protein
MHVNTNLAKPDGILNPKVSETKFQLERLEPATDLRFFIERYWIIHWDLRGQAPYVSENLPFPCVNMVVEPQKSGIFGVVTSKFTHRLEGKSAVFGIKFRPGAFYPFYQQAVSELTDTYLPITTVFGVAGREYETAILAQDNDSERIAIAESFLRTRLPQEDETITVINQIIDCIRTQPTITKVDDMLYRIPMSKRTLQRIFRQYVGVSPKWVIQRYRLQEAADLLAAGHVENWSALALKLGYFDQAHFIKDFKTIVGKTPAEYGKNSGVHASLI